MRDRTISDVATLGQREWQKASGYHRQARVDALFRYKSILGDGRRARSVGGRDVEASLACRILKRMTGGARVVADSWLTPPTLGEVRARCRAMHQRPVSPPYFFSCFR